MVEISVGALRLFGDERWSRGKKRTGQPVTITTGVCASVAGRRMRGRARCPASFRLRIDRGPSLSGSRKCEFLLSTRARFARVNVHRRRSLTEIISIKQAATDICEYNSYSISQINRGVLLIDMNTTMQYAVGRIKSKTIVYLYIYYLDKRLPSCWTYVFSSSSLMFVQHCYV